MKHLDVKNGLISGERYLSVADLDERSRQAVGALHHAGIWKGDKVALLLRNDFSFFEATRAAVLLGASTVPMNWHLTADEISYILDDCGAKVLIGHADLLTEAILAACSDVEVICVPLSDEIGDAYKVTPKERTANRGLPDWNVWISAFEPWQQNPTRIIPPMFYTSGTTGQPKGVKRQHVSPEIMKAMEARTGIAFGLVGNPVRSVMTGPVYHSAPNGYAHKVLMEGGLLILQPRFNPEELLQLVETYKITHLHMVPTMFVRLLALPKEVRDNYDISTLEFVCHGSAPCPDDIKRAMIEWWGPVIHEYYAMTETGLITASDSEGWLGHPGSVGKPLPGVDIRILDDDGNIRPAGTPDEICVRSEVTSHVTYHHAEEKTEAMRRGDFIATGDIGYLDEDGYLYISDRKADMVISGGVNIYPAEIEAALFGNGKVVDCAVFGVPDPEYGERLIAVIQPKGDVSAEEIIFYLKERIASFKVPREILFRDNLPREDSGKIKKRLLRDELKNAS